MVSLWRALLHPTHPSAPLGLTEGLMAQPDGLQAAGLAGRLQPSHIVTCA